MQYYVHNGHAGPVLVQYRLASGANLEFWVDAKSISEGKHGALLCVGRT